MAERTTWNGKTYNRWPNSKRHSDRAYFQRSFTGGVEYLHRCVWESINGPVPAGMHIHHRDGNPANNDISNLECVSPIEHGARHKWSEDRKAKQRPHLAAIRPLAAAWHRTDAGAALHRELGKIAWGNFVPVEKPCGHCAKPFLPRKIGNVDIYCSNACRAAARRASGVDNETRICDHCGAEFIANRYAKTQTCGGACANRRRARKG